MDSIEIQGLCIQSKIGIHAWEQAILQKILIDISIPCDLSQCLDEISNTIDYEALSLKLIEFIQNKSFNLIETLAEEVATLLKREYKLDKLTVRVSKPGALKQAANVAVCIER